MQNYKILAKPNLTNVIRGKIMSFSLQRINPNAPALEHIRASWICYNHISYRNHDKYLAKPVNGPRNSLEWNEAKWSIEGQHKIVCEIKYANNTEYVEHIQNVINAKQTVAYSSNTLEESENPFIFYKNLSEQIEWTRREEKHQQLSDEDEKAYQNRMELLEKFKEKLKFLLDKIPNDCRDNFISVSVKHIASFYGDAESISLRVGCFCYDKEAYLIDWTNPLERIACGVYVGKGDNEEDAIRDAINSWDNENRYPEGIMKGRIQYENNKRPIEDNEKDKVEVEETIKIEGEAHLPPIIVTPTRLIKIEFETDGKSDLDTLSDFLNTLAIAAIIVAGIVTLVAPVPGSRVVSGLIWTSMAASTTSAVINIADRHSEGFGNWRDDSLDTLTIIANAFSAGTLSAGTKWASKALTLTNISQKQVVKITLIGQISADSLQGILMTEELALAIYSVMNNKEIPADIKLSKISALLSRGVIDGVLITVNIHGNKKNLTALKNETSSSQIMMSLEEVDQYISGKKAFNKVNIEDSLSNKPNTKTPPETNKMEANNIIETNNKMITNLVNDIENLKPKIKDEKLTQIVTAQVDDNGVKKTFSAIYLPKWHKESVEQRSIINGGEFFEKLLQSNLIEGKKLSSLTSSEPSNTTNLDAGKRKANTNEPESKTTVYTNHATKKKGLQELEDELNTLKNSKMNPKEIKKRVALAQTRCEVEGIVSQANFYNLQIPNYKILKKPEVGIIEAIDNTYYRFIDVEEYMNLLKKSYQDSNALYPNVTAGFTEMHPTTERLIKEFIANHQQFRIIDGLPGMHAEVLSTNNVFQQLEAKGKNVEAYLDKIEVNTIRLTEYEQGKAFPACRHCSGILSKSKGISIPTGRVDD